MNFGIFLPKEAEDGKVPVIYWLSGNPAKFYILVNQMFWDSQTYGLGNICLAV